MKIKKAKLRVSELMIFEEEVCTECLNDNGDDKMCYILGELSASGECDGVFDMESIDQQTGSFQKCLMRRVDEDVNSENIIDWIETARTEQVATILNCICESYHYDVIKDKQ